MVKFLPMALSRPGWALRLLNRRHPGPASPEPRHLPQGRPHLQRGATSNGCRPPPPTWGDVAWLREQWKGPFIVKGVSRATTRGERWTPAQRHLGLQPRGQQPRRHPGVHACAASGRGRRRGPGRGALRRRIRRGSDVVKALALGARAVMIGRAWLWGLAAGGERGVREVLEILRGGIDEALIGLGHRSVKDLSPEDLVIPEGLASACRRRRRRTSDRRRPSGGGERPAQESGRGIQRPANGRGQSRSIDDVVDASPRGHDARLTVPDPHHHLRVPYRPSASRSCSRAAPPRSAGTASTRRARRRWR